MNYIKWRFKGHHKEFITPEPMLNSQISRWRTRLDLNPMNEIEILSPEQKKIEKQDAPVTDTDHTTDHTDGDGSSNVDEQPTVRKTTRKRTRTRPKTS